MYKHRRAGWEAGATGPHSSHSFSNQKVRSCLQSRHPAQGSGNKPADGPKGKGKEKGKHKRSDPPQRDTGGGRGLEEKPWRNPASQGVQEASLVLKTAASAQNLQPCAYAKCQSTFLLMDIGGNIVTAAPKKLVAQQGAGVSRMGVQQLTTGSFMGRSRKGNRAKGQSRAGQALLVTLHFLLNLSSWPCQSSCMCISIISASCSRAQPST